MQITQTRESNRHLLDKTSCNNLLGLPTAKKVPWLPRISGPKHEKESYWFLAMDGIGNAKNFTGKMLLLMCPVHYKQNKEITFKLYEKWANEIDVMFKFFCKKDIHCLVITILVKFNDKPFSNILKCNGWSSITCRPNISEY